MGWPKGKPRGTKAESGFKLIKGGTGVDPSTTEGLDGGPVDAIDPAALTGNSGRIPAERSRKGRKERPDPAETRPPDLDVSGWAGLLIGIHETLKIWSGAPEFALDAAEAELLAQAAGKVARWYKLPGIAEKSLDWTNLALALNQVYTPRILAARFRKAARAKPAPQNVNVSRPAQTGPQAAPSPPPRAEPADPRSSRGEPSQPLPEPELSVFVGTDTIN